MHRIREPELRWRPAAPLDGRWVKERLAQSVTNRVANAVQHGARDGPIRVAACGDEPGTVTVSVATEGPTILHDRIAGIFDAMKGGGNGHDLERRNDTGARS